MKIQNKKVKNILTKSSITDGYSVNPYVGCSHKCVYCYAEYMKNWTGHDTEKWGEFVDVKDWEPLTDKQKKSLYGKSVFISSATDPYQPVEWAYRRTRQFLEDIQGTGANVTIVTKSDFVLRDRNLLKPLNATVALSINTLDNEFRSDMDMSVSVHQKLRALEELYKQGIHTVCFISPMFPGITDVPSIIERVDGICDEVWLEQLVLNYPYKGHILYYIKTKYPELYPYYDKLYNQEDNSGWDDFDRYMAEWCLENGYEYYHDDQPKIRRDKPIVINQRGHKEFKERHRKQ